MAVTSTWSRQPAAIDEDACTTTSMPAFAANLTAPGVVLMPKFARFGWFSARNVVNPCASVTFAVVAFSAGSGLSSTKALDGSVHRSGMLRYAG